MVTKTARFLKDRSFRRGAGPESNVEAEAVAAELAEMLLKAEGSIAALERTAARITPTADRTEP